MLAPRRCLPDQGTAACAQVSDKPSPAVRLHRKPRYREGGVARVVSWSACCSISQFPCSTFGGRKACNTIRPGCGCPSNQATPPRLKANTLPSVGAPALSYATNSPIHGSWPTRATRSPTRASSTPGSVHAPGLGCAPPCPPAPAPITRPFPQRGARGCDTADQGIPSDIAAPGPPERSAHAPWDSTDDPRQPAADPPGHRNGMANDKRFQGEPQLDGSS